MSKQNSDIDKPEKEKKEEIENTSEKEVADKKENNNEIEEPAEETEDALEGSEEEQAEEASREDELNRLLSELTESKENTSDCQQSLTITAGELSKRKWN
jgi:organic radical activating enzyme